MKPKLTLNKVDGLVFVALLVCIVNGVFTGYLLTQLDAIVNVQLYNFDLQFSKEWAVPYWTNLRLIYFLAGMSIVLSGLGLALSSMRMKQQKLMHFSEQKNKTEAEAFVKAPENQVKSGTGPKEVTPVVQGRTVAGEPPIVKQKQQEISPAVLPNDKPKAKENDALVISCPNCGKFFSRPLVMLDFSGGKTRLVSICPYCNHKLGEVSEGKEEEDDASETAQG
jgi:uncharacterized Zn-finger protein